MVVLWRLVWIWLVVGNTVLIGKVIAYRRVAVLWTSLQQVSPGGRHQSAESIVPWAFANPIDRMHRLAILVGCDAQEGTPLFGRRAWHASLGDGGTDLVRPSQTGARAGFTESKIATKAILTSRQLPHRSEAGHKEAESREIVCLDITFACRPGFIGPASDLHRPGGRERQERDSYQANVSHDALTLLVSSILDVGCETAV